MTGKTRIKAIVNAVFCWRKKGNEIIDWCNRDWLVKMEDDRLGAPAFQSSKDKVTLDLSKIKSVELIACDEDGNQATYTLLGFKHSE